MQKSLFIFGLGFSAQEIAKVAMARGYKVSGTCRSAEKCEELKARGIDAFLFEPLTLTLSPEGRGKECLAQSTHILSSIPPQETGDIALPVIRHMSSVIWKGYLSTTGVYGDYAGEWVSEESETRPNNARLQRRVEAEKKWQEIGGHIFRLAGIYGAGRSVLDDILAGTARRVEKAGQVFSRIHVEDIANTVLFSMEAPNLSRIYNVCDDEPAPAHEVVKFGCELLGKEIPQLIPFAEADFSPMGREFYSANRRVSNQRIKHELGVKLKYHTYREGLQALFATSLNQ